MNFMQEKVYYLLGISEIYQCIQSTFSFHTEQFTNMKCCAMCYEHDKKKFIVTHLHQVLWTSCFMVHPTCIKLPVILRLAKEYAIKGPVNFMKMIYRSDMSKIYANASHNHHFTSYHTESKLKTPGLTSRYFRSTTHGTQATNQQIKCIMMITFFTHLKGKRAHL